MSIRARQSRKVLHPDSCILTSKTGVLLSPMRLDTAERNGQHRTMNRTTTPRGRGEGSRFEEVGSQESQGDEHGNHCGYR